MKSRRPAQDNVVKLAGVSQSAVFHMSNWNDSTQQEGKYQCLLDAIDRLGYAPIH